MRLVMRLTMRMATQPRAMVIAQQNRRSIPPLVATTGIASIFRLHIAGLTTGGPVLQRPMSPRVAETPPLIIRIPMAPPDPLVFTTIIVPIVALPVPMALTTLIVLMVVTALVPMASPALIDPLALTVLMTLTAIFVLKGLVRCL